jgi:hypothetical protein
MDIHDYSLVSSGDEAVGTRYMPLLVGPLVNTVSTVTQLHYQLTSNKVSSAIELPRGVSVVV